MLEKIKKPYKMNCTVLGYIIILNRFKLNLTEMDLIFYWFLCGINFSSKLGRACYRYIPALLDLIPT